MIIHVITNVHNEALLMPYFLRHYESFADRIFVYDAGSDDGTRELVKACPKATLIDWDCDGVNDEKYMALNNSAYIEHSRGVADWVLMVDVDEFVYQPNPHSGVRRLLEAYQPWGFNLVTPEGYNLVHDRFPTTPGQIYDEVKRGVAHPAESKPCIFDPMLTMNFGVGKHDARPEPLDRVRFAPPNELLMLHAAWLGLEYRQQRMAARAARMSQINKDRGWGTYCLDPAESIARQFEIASQWSVQVVE